MPTVAIVGRPNVGKSALFNRLVGRKIAIVHDQAGITRDRLSAPSKVTKFPCEIVDTGGIGATLDDGFAEQVAFEVDIAIATADLIMFVVDAHDGMTAIDAALSQKLRKAKAPVLLVPSSMVRMQLWQQVVTWYWCVIRPTKRISFYRVLIRRSVSTLTHRHSALQP
jgi:small GTP-binding protein